MSTPALLPLPSAELLRNPAPVPVTLASGDGIGPEIMDVTLRLLEAAGARLDLRPITLGQAVYAQGHTSGITPEAWDTLRATRLLLKGPITTPQGGGFKSLNVTLRKSMGLYANVRPCVAYAPFVPTRHPGMDVVIIRENEEDLYAGIEHQHTPDVTQCLKLITRSGSERIIRYAFAYARTHGRSKVTCMTKDNIMKLTDGLFHRVFEEVGQAYPDLQQEHLIVDIGAARLADTPERFDVVVLPNLYGDILSDIAAQVAGSVGLAPSANIGAHGAMFEAIHGSAPDIAGQDLANPSGLLLAATQLLAHVGQGEAAMRLQNAWLRTLEDGVHTADLHRTDSRNAAVGTQAFGKAVEARLGEVPRRLRPMHVQAAPLVLTEPPARPRPAKATVGVDLFLHAPETTPEALGQALRQVSTAGLSLALITNRGVKVWPDGFPETTCVDHWRCRFQAQGTVTGQDVVALLQAVVSQGFDVVKTETLCTFDGKPGFSLGQGQ